MYSHTVHNNEGYGFGVQLDGPNTSLEKLPCSNAMSPLVVSDDFYIETVLLFDG